MTQCENCGLYITTARCLTCGHEQGQIPNSSKCDACGEGSLPRLEGHVCSKCKRAGWALIDDRQHTYSWELYRDEKHKLVVIMN